MSQKIARRAVLGTLIGGLAALPFALRGMRKQNTVDEVAPYAKIDVSPLKYGSSLPTGDFGAAFDSFFTARNEWVRFRGISGKIKVSADMTQNGEVLPTPPALEGLIFLKLAGGSAEDLKAGFPVYGYSLDFSSIETGEKEWSFFYDQKTRKEKFIGEKNGMASDAPVLISQILAFPAEIFADFTNIKLDGAQGLWKVESPPSDTNKIYAFRPNDKRAGSLMPSFFFENGKLKEINGKKQEGVPFAALVLSDYTESNGFSYPLTQTFEHRENGKPMPKKLKFTIALSNVSVVTVS